MKHRASFTARFGLATVLALLTLLIFGAVSAFAQGPVWQESFNTDTGYTASETCNDNSYDFFTRTDGSDIGSGYVVTGQDGAYFFAAQDTDGAPCTSATETITFTAVSISGLTNLQFSGFFAEDDSSDGNEDWDANSSVYVEYQIDGGPWVKILQFSAEGGTNTVPRQDTNFDGTGDGTALTPAFAEYSANIPDTGDSIIFRISVDYLDAGDEDVSFDLIT